MANRWTVNLILLLCAVSFESSFTVRAYSDQTMGSHADKSMVKVQLPPEEEIATKPQRPTTLPSGLWGGEHIRLEVTQAGTTVEYDCAHATISGRIVTDRLGRFVVMGTHVDEHGGPVRETEPSNGYPVQFMGRVIGKKLQLTVRRRDSRKSIGVFTLFYGQESALVKCR